MKRFDTSSNLDRLMQRLQIKEEWSKIIEQGAIGNTLTTIAEEENELARYMEYLFQENKWKTARNISSLTHLGALLSKKRERPISAIGNIIVSHTDENNINRLAGYGSIYFNIDTLSDYDNITRSLSPTIIEQNALVPWTINNVYEIPEYTVFKDSSGFEFFSTEAVKARYLKEPFSIIKSNEEKYQSFLKEGGWNGIKYIKVPIIQGKFSKIDFGYASGARFESFTIETLNVEAAKNSISNKYFSVKVIPANSNELNAEKWSEIVNIRLASPYDKVFETKILDKASAILIKFGDGITGQLLPANSKVICEYIETDGNSGNIINKFQINSMTLPNGQSFIDPRNNEANEFLHCTNILPIAGGKDIENEVDFKENTPKSYLKSYSISTLDNYREKILKYSPISLLHLKLFYSNVFTSTSYGSYNNEYMSIISNDVLTEISSNRKFIGVTALRSDGSIIEDPVNELIKPLTATLFEVSSQADSFNYIEPNLVPIRANISIYTKSFTLDKDIKEQITNKVLSSYSIYNQGFNNSYYYSVIDAITHSSDFTVYSNTFFEALAKTNMVPIIIKPSGLSMKDLFSSKETLLAFPFSFDKIFSKYTSKKGFYNHNNKSSYMLKLNIKFKMYPEKNTTYFLYDNRATSLNELDLLSSEVLPINASKPVPNIVATYNNNNFQQISFYNQFLPEFQNRQVRESQYSFIDYITTDEAMSNIKTFGNSNSEIRPLNINNFGENILYELDNVPVSSRVSLDFKQSGKEVDGSHCYYKNDKYNDYIKILFNENYDKPDSSTYANGFFITSIFNLFDSVELDNMKKIFENDIDLSNIAKDVSTIIGDSISIDVYAKPLATEFIPINEQDLIYSNAEHIYVEKTNLN